jgi:hypothetical protein
MGLFKSKSKPSLNISEETRIWIEHNIGWLRNTFNKKDPFQLKIIIGDQHDFPLNLDGTHESCLQASAIIAQQMQININEVQIVFTKPHLKEIDMGTGMNLFMQSHENFNENLGSFFNKNENNLCIVTINETILKQPQQMIATLAHEFSHIKLLGENRIPYNDEPLTDLTTVVYGFGIFNANTAFEYHQFDHGWSYQTSGYLNQAEWAYALGLFSFIKQDYNPHWKKYLNKTIRKDVDRNLAWMVSNKEKVKLELQQTPAPSIYQFAKPGDHQALPPKK